MNVRPISKSIYSPNILGEISVNWVQQLFFLIKYLDNFGQINIATLGPKGTSSEATASYLLSQLNNPNAIYSLFSSYEEALQSLLSKKTNLLLIANAYQAIDKAYMCPDLTLLFSFVYDTPCYGIAKKIGYELPKNHCLKIASHHAPSNLIPRLLDSAEMEYKIVLVDSTSVAAMKAEQGEVDLCVTNSNSVKMYGLEFISLTRPIRMLWSTFGRV